jgi:hypothetical protein
MRVMKNADLLKTLAVAKEWSPFPTGNSDVQKWKNKHGWYKG